MSRPSTYADQVGAEICGRIAGGESLRRICKADRMPSQSTVFVWLRQNDAFRQLYTLAREDQAEFWAEEILEIADDGTNDFMARTRADGSTEIVVDHEHIQQSGHHRVDGAKLEESIQPLVQQVELVRQAFASWGEDEEARTAFLEEEGRAGRIAPDAELDFSAMYPDAPILHGLEAWLD